MTNNAKISAKYGDFRLYYHPESECYFWERIDRMTDPLCDDVTGIEAHMSEAAWQGVSAPDLSSAGGESGAIAAAMKKWARKPSDFYPTPADVTYSFLPILESYAGQGDTIVEMACGNGDMARPLIEAGYEVEASDLNPEPGYGERGVDYLGKPYTGEATIGMTNPPFVAAEEFIRKMTSEFEYSFLLLKSTYYHAKRRKGLFREIPPVAIHPLSWRPAFLLEERGNSPFMECIWVVFERGYTGQTIYCESLDRLDSCPVDPADDQFGGL